MSEGMKVEENGFAKGKRNEWVESVGGNVAQ
jgi:hypothetical protein